MSISHLRPNREAILQELKDYLKTKYLLSDKEVKKYLAQDAIKPAAQAPKDIFVPTSIFNETVSPLESIVKYLKETKNMKLVEIAKITARDQRAIGVTYKSAAKKMPAQYGLEITKYKIPAGILKDKKFSVAEHIVKHLKESYNLNYHEIATIMKRDERTIWTLYHRAESKQK